MHVHRPLGEADPSDREAVRKHERLDRIDVRVVGADDARQLLAGEWCGVGRTSNAGAVYPGGIPGAAVSEAKGHVDGFVIAHRADDACTGNWCALASGDRDRRTLPLT